MMMQGAGISFEQLARDTEDSADIVANLRNIRDHLRSGRFGQREVWIQQLEDAAAEIERLRAALMNAIPHLPRGGCAWLDAKAALEQKA